MRAWHHTYGLPVVVTNCSNNYGPYQFPEKLIPLMILNALRRASALPVYGSGRERARLAACRGSCARRSAWRSTAGKPGGRATMSAAERSGSNLDVVRDDLRHPRRAAPDSAGPRERLIPFVTDRPGHDLRYAIDAAHAQRELGWAPRATFESGLEATVRWYLDNVHWWQGACRAAMAASGWVAAG